MDPCFPLLIVLGGVITQFSSFIRALLLVLRIIIVIIVILIYISIDYSVVLIVSVLCLR